MLIAVDNCALLKISTMTGYSETPLIKKLGIKEEMKILLMNAPKDYMKILEYNITKQLVNKISDADFAHVFVISKEELKKSFMKIISEAKEQAKVEASRIIADAQEAINNQKMAALTDVKNQVGSLVLDVAEKVLRRELNNKTAQETFIKELASTVKFN